MLDIENIIFTYHGVCICRYYDRNTYLENMRWNTYLKENLV